MKYNDFGSTETKGKKAEARDGHDVLKTNSTPWCVLKICDASLLDTELAGCTNA